MQRTAAALLAFLTPMAFANPVTPAAAFSARDLAAEEARFAAHSLRHGMRAAFIDRRGRPYGQTPHQAHITVKSMTELADVLLA